jgi:hypothetical protein
MLTLMLTALLAAPPQSPPQSPPDWQLLPSGLAVHHVAVPGCPRQAFVVFVPDGFDRDPVGQSGLAQARANYAAALAGRELPADADRGSEVLGPGTVFWASLPVAAAAAGGRWAAALLAPPADVDADLAALALARAALAADDAEHDYPGPMLRSRLRRAMFAGTPAGRCERGEPTELQALSPAQCGFGARAPSLHGCRLAVLGGADVAAQLAAIPAFAATAAVAAVAPMPTPRPVPPVGAMVTTHAQAGGPYVAAALPAPAADAADAAAHALAVAVLTARAFDAFTEPRRGATDAQAPFVHFGWLEGDPAVVVTRRGPDGAPAEVPRRQIDALLRSLHERPANAQEIDTARQQLQRTLQLPPFAPAVLLALQQAPPALVARGRTLVLAAALGVRADAAVAAVAADLVRARLDAMARIDAWTFAGLLPAVLPARSR